MIKIPYHHRGISQLSDFKSMHYFIWSLMITQYLVMKSGVGKSLCSCILKIKPHPMARGKMPSTMVALLTCTSLNRTKPSPNFSSPRLYYGGFQWYYFMSFIKMFCSAEIDSMKHKPDEVRLYVNGCVINCKCLRTNV